MRPCAGRPQLLPWPRTLTGFYAPGAGVEPALHHQALIQLRPSELVRSPIHVVITAFATVRVFTPLPPCHETRQIIPPPPLKISGVLRVNTASTLATVEDSLVLRVEPGTRREACGGSRKPTLRLNRHFPRDDFVPPPDRFSFFVSHACLPRVERGLLSRLAGWLPSFSETPQNSLCGSSEMRPARPKGLRVWHLARL